MREITDLFSSLPRSVLDPDFVRTRRMSDVIYLFRILSRSASDPYFVRVTL